MGADQSVHKPDVDSAGIASWDSRCSAADEEAPSPQREKTHDEYRHTIWLHDELTRERRLHRGISENIVLEDFRRGELSLGKYCRKWV